MGAKKKTTDEEKTEAAKILTSIAGGSFSYEPGQVVMLTKTMFDAWVMDGLCEAAPDAEGWKSDAGARAERIAELESCLPRLDKKIAALTIANEHAQTEIEGKAVHIEELTKQLADVSAQLDAVNDDLSDASEENLALRAILSDNDINIDALDETETVDDATSDEG
jgi:septal ring factor EnvC (AmiA/AmiB activator)